jgi:glycosyltransferase involved in cell wall biosynthesis
VGEPRVIHAITPGDHYSPRTGSAIPTVVDGIARAAAASSHARHDVLVAAGTYPDRYDSARAVEYVQAAHLSRTDRQVDRLSGLLVRRRPRANAQLAPMLREQGSWPASAILAHNLVGLVGLTDATRHRPVLYAHNELLRTYTRREAGRALDGADVIVCVSQFLADLTASRLPTALRRRVVAIHNGVDCDHFRPQEGPSTGSGMRVLFVGRVVPEKGADVLLRALAALGRADVTATVVGSSGFARDDPLTDYEKRLREVAAGIRIPVDFQPFTPRAGLAELLRKHDVLVVPSQWREPATLTVGEGLASGLPVIASRVGGIPEVVAHAELLVPPGDPDALAETLEWLANDGPARERLGRESRAHALENDWGRTWRELSATLAR